MPQSLHALGAHIVFSTKGRVPNLAEPFRSRSQAYIATVLQDMGCRGIAIGGVEDHVHVLCLLTKSHSSTAVLQKVKQESSKVIKTFDPRLSDFHWQSGYGMFGVSPRDFPMIREYVSRQEEHHKRETFQEEFRRLLEEAGVEFDERYVWD